MDQRGIKMGWSIGGICGPMVELLKKGKVGKVIDVQDFDLDAVRSIHRTPGHYEMSASQYANPANKGAFVNKLDFVVLAALEIDIPDCPVSLPDCKPCPSRIRWTHGGSPPDPGIPPDQWEEKKCWCLLFYF